ncbi:MAG TPA: DUF4129 domain-containing protein [Pyrinomonadaceae bacterium]|nr:DUF4129 domain-containing protein [Pyrinomonadaceae bacterium]
MLTRHSRLEKNSLPRWARRLVQYAVALPLVLFCFSLAQANTLSQYHQRIKQAITALDTLNQSDENESQTQFEARDEETVRRVRELIPESEKVDFSGSTIPVNNSWFHLELKRYSDETTRSRYELLKGTIERLKALEERITEFEKAPTTNGASKEEESRKLSEILNRDEYAHKIKQESAILDWLLKKLQSFLPKPRQLSPGSAGIVSRIAQIVVIVLAVAVIVFVLKMFLPKLLREGRSQRKRKEKARIVLGEVLEPEQSGRDLLAEAEALARRGELRAAIRRGYIALLVELGDRKVISLAQHKTNHDYLRALRGLEPLHRNVKQLTDSFELHWYGLSQANETDWLAFRATYDQALR